MTDDIQRVRIYLREQDRWENRQLYQVLLERLQQEGATGATVLRGLAGFGPGQRLRPTASAGNSRDNAPLVLEWVDRAERIQRILPQLAELLHNALVTREDIQIYHALLRGRGRFSDTRKVLDVMRSEVYVAAPELLLGPALNRMLAENQHTLPVVDEQRRLLGVVADEELQRRAGLALPLRLLRLLTPEERSDMLGSVAQHPLADVMNHELRTIYAGAAIPQALPTMIEWNYRQIAVIERDGSFQGLLGIQEVLAASLNRDPGADQNIRDADPPTPIRLIMQTSVPQIQADQPLAAALAMLLAVGRSFVAVLDDQGGLLGLLDDEYVIGHLHGTERQAMLESLRHNQITAALPGADRLTGDFVKAPDIMLAPEDPINQATSHLLEHDLERLPVVDSQQRFLGIVARGALLRALEQEDE